MYIFIMKWCYSLYYFISDQYVDFSGCDVLLARSLGCCFMPYVLNLLQAYRDELELELAHLQEENARLRRQQEEVK